MYESKYHSLPPAYTTNAKGTPLYSWRLILIGELDRPDLADLVNSSEPWNGPHNIQLSNVSVSTLHCPSDRDSLTTPTTNYFAVVGPNTAWPGAVGRKASDIKNPTKTILLVESDDSGINWTEPRDLDITQLTARINQRGQAEQAISSHHFEKGANVLFADGHVEFLSEDTDPNEIRKMLDVRNP